MGVEAAHTLDCLASQTVHFWRRRGRLENEAGRCAGDEDSAISSDVGHGPKRMIATFVGGFNSFRGGFDGRFRQVSIADLKKS